MKTNYPHLFQPLTIRGVTFRNRILSAPLGIWAMVPEDGLNETWLRYMSVRAAGGAAGVSLGDTQVNCCEPEVEAVGKVLQLRGPNVPTAFLSEFADVVHRHGAVATIELAHVGSGGLSRDGKGTYGPVARAGFFGQPGHAMTVEQIRETIRQYVECVTTMKRSGFRMATIHGGHNKLIDQFLSPANNRDDEYGGCLENRMRFCLEVVDAVRQAVGEDFVLELRLTCFTPEDDPARFEELVTLVERVKGKIDIINASHEPYQDPDSPVHTSDGTAVMPGYLLPPAANAVYAAALKERVPDGIYIGAVGGIISPDIAEDLLSRGKADFVILGRALVADPEFPKKARRNRAEDIRPCIGCLKCLDIMHGTHIMRCSVNPRTGKEYCTDPHARANEPKRVAVVGGGAAGMQAALTCAQRGHTVTLYEQSDALGGILKHFAGDSVKYRLNLLRDWFIRQVEQSTVEVRLNTEATCERLLADGQEAVILATGSVPVKPGIPGIDGDNVLHVTEAMERLDSLPQNIAIIGGNLSGCEFAVSLLRSGRSVTVLDMAPRLHMGGGMDIDWHMQGARTEVNARCTAITDGGVVFEREGKEHFIPADAVVYAVGMKSHAPLEKELREEFADFWNVGDSRCAASVLEGIRDGYHAALDL